MGMKDVQWKEETGFGDVWNYKDKGEGAEIAGLYLGSESGIGQNDSIMHFLEVDGEKVGIWGNTILDKRFKNYKPGQVLVRVVYKGVTKSDKTGRSYHDFKVFKAPIAGMINDEDIEEVKDAF